jgi:xanthine dehydrogenase accessory factor
MPMNVEKAEVIVSNPYKIIQNKTKENQVVLMTTVLHSKKEGLQEEWKRTMILEGSLEGNDRESYQEAIRAGKPIWKQQSKEKEYGVLVEPFFPRERLIILGGGHIALPLVEMAAKVGFQVTVVDDRPTFANAHRFPTAKQVICESFTSCFQKLHITRNDYIVIITRGHRHDTECLRQILVRPETIYVGMIGSKRRVSIVKQDLIEEGFDNERLSRLCSPIGLPIGAATPEEISISILAELIQRKRIGTNQQMLVNRSDLDSYMIEVLAKTQTEPQTEPCCLVTIIHTQGSTPRGVGAKMLVYPSGKIIGSIGGGCSESAIMRTALELIGSKRWKVEEINMTMEEAQEEGMVCGGTMIVLLEDFVTD